MTESALYLPDFWPKQKIFFESEGTRILYGGDTRGGKTAAVKLCLIRWCMMIPGLKCDIFRFNLDDVKASYMEDDFSFPVLLDQWIADKLVVCNSEEVKFWNGSHITLQHCFVADTPIQTSEGIKTLKELIGSTGKVNITKELTGEFKNVRKTRERAPIVEVKFDDGTVYRCTPDHKFITTEGIVQAKDLAGCLCVTNESKLSAIQFKRLTAADITLTENIIVHGPSDFIGSFGNIITATSPKVLKSTIRMKTEIITKSKIWNYWKDRFIEVCTQIHQKLKKEVSRLLQVMWLEQLSGLGIDQQTAMSGTNSNLLKLCDLELIGCANDAAQFSRGLGTIDFVEINAERQRQGKETDTSFLNHVLFAARNLKPVLEPELKPAKKNVESSFKHKRCESVIPVGNDDVYCLTVPEFGYFPLSNGVLVSNCSTDNAMQKHQGIAKHVRVFDEAGQIPERRMKWLSLWMTMNEDKKESIPEEWRGRFPKIIYLSNPLGPSKPFLRKMFVKARPKYAIETVGAWKLQYIPARVDDNRSEDPEVTKLRVSEEMDPATARALLSEDWDTQTGNYFAQWDSDIHTIPDFVIPDFWLRFRTFDYGSYEPWACLWWAVSPGVEVGNRYLPRGCLICYREWYGCKAEHPGVDPKDLEVTNLAPQGWSNIDIANGIIERTEERFDDQPTFTDKFPFNKLGGRTIAKEFKDAGVILTLGDTDRRNGWAQMGSKLTGEKLIAGSEERWPMMVFFESCKYCQDYIPMIERNPDEGRQWDAEEHGEASHINDCCRYAAMANKVVSDAPKIVTDETITKHMMHPRNKRTTIRDIVPNLGF